MKLHSKIYGNEDSHLIIIHGLFGMSDNWNTLGKRFSDRFTTHLVDLRNHGRSPHHQEFNYDVMSEDILEYMNDHRIEKAIILGHSLGGKVAMKYSFTYPNRVKKLIVVDISPRKYDTTFHKDVIKTLYKMPIENFKTRDELNMFLCDVFTDESMRLFLLKNLYRDDKKRFAWRFNIDVLLEKLDNIQDASFIEGQCDIPVCFFRGGNSNYITEADELIIQKHFSDFEVTTINDAGHWIHAEKPTRFFTEVMNFLLDSES